MEKNLQSRLPNFWLNNAGFDGHSTFGHLQLLNQVIKDIHPDYILYLVGVNEIGRKDLNTFDAGLDPENLSLRNKIIMKSELLSTIQVLSRTLRAIKLGNNHMPDMDFSQQEKFEISDVRVLQLLTLHRNEFLPEYRNRLSKLLNETIAAGIVPIIATQPAIWGDVRDPTLKIPLGPLMFVDGIDSSTQWKIMNLYNSVTKEEAKSNGVQVIDLGNLMPKDTRYFYDWVHYSNEGAEVVATILANKIFPILESSLKAKTTH
jgi:lysophospholipase L1-like esterase